LGTMSKMKRESSPGSLFPFLDQPYNQEDKQEDGESAK